MGTQREQMKEVISCLVFWACRAGTRDFCSALATLVGPVVKHFFSHRKLFQFFCPHRTASWARSHAGSPVSYCSVRLRLKSKNKMFVLEEIPLCVIIYRWFGRSPDNMKSELKNLSSLDIL